MSLRLTDHAHRRMSQRGLSEDAITATMTYGREVRTRGAVIYAIGKKEVLRHLVNGTDLRDFEGIQVVCVSDGTILTVYKNRNFSGLRDRQRGHRSAA
jgi:hypothetical protein